MKLSVALLLALPLDAVADGLPTQPYIYVEGKADAQKLPDLVTLRFDLVARAGDQVKANEDVQARANKALALLDASKVVSADIVAENLRSEPQFEHGEAYAPDHGKLVGFTVTRPFQVKIRDVTAYPKLVDSLIGSVAAEFSGIDGGLTNENELRDQAWDKALTDARQRADRALKSTGMKIDSIFAISPVAFPEIPGRIFGGSGQAQPMAAEGPSKAAYSSQYRLAPITISQSLHVIYLISPAK